MDFTREPIIETIITPREGCKLVVKNSKSIGQEEFFVDAIEVVSFGKALFFRCLEKPKPFLVPVSDYEVLEVREARMVLKTAGPERAIKIGGGRETAPRPPKEVERTEEVTSEAAAQPSETGTEAQPSDGRAGKKRERRRQYRSKRKGQEEEGSEETQTSTEEGVKSESIHPVERQKEGGSIPISPAALSALLAPPPMLISETIGRYRESAAFKSAFFLTAEEEYKPHDKVKDLLNEDEDEQPPHLPEPAFDSVETSEKSELSLSDDFVEGSEQSEITEEEKETDFTEQNIHDDPLPF